MTFQDLVVTPLWFFMLLVGAYVIRPFATSKQTRPYFIPGLLAKFIGALAIGIIYQFYYGWGDTFTYFREARIIWSFFIESPTTALRIIFQRSESVSDLFHLTSRLWTFKSPENFTMIRILSFLNLFTLNTYSATALIFATFSFSGSWAFYSVLAKKYSHLHRHLAISILFVPSVIIWGSGIFKDTLTYGGLMWVSWAAFKYIEFKKISPISVIMGLLGLAIVAKIKAYILICFIPLVFIWMFSRVVKQIKNSTLRLLSYPFFVILGIFFGVIGAQQASSINQKYALENIATTARVTAYDIAYFSGKGGSTYSLGELDDTWSTMLGLAPMAINVTLFRPYLWEVSNPLMLLNALESMCFLGLSLWIILFRRRNLAKILKDPFILMSLGFSLLFAFAVGISTYNFGTLARYKIPMMPYYATVLALIIDFSKERLNEKWR